MALETQIVDVPLRGGLAEAVAPELLPPGTWLTMDNVELSKEGEIRKRGGFRKDTQSGLWGDTYAVGEHVARSEVLGISFDPSEVSSERYSGGGVRLSARSASGAWQDRGSLPPFEVERRPLVRSHFDLDQSCVQVAVTGAVRLVAWVSPPTIVGASHSEIWIRADDIDTGHVRIPEQRISSPPALGGEDRPSKVAVFVSGNYFVVVWDTIDGAGAFVRIVGWRIATDLSSQDSAGTALSLTAGSRGLEWDACHLDGNSAGTYRWAYCIVNQSSGNLDVYSVVTATMADTWRYQETGFISTITAPVMHARVNPDSVNGYAYVLLGWIESSTPVFRICYTSTNPFTGLFIDGGLESSGSWDRCVVYLDSTTHYSVVAYSGEPTSGEEETRFWFLDNEDAFNAVWSPGFSRILGQEIWSRPFEPFDDGRVFLITTSYTGTGKRDSGYQLIDTYTLSNRFVDPPGWHGHLGRYGGKGQPPLSPVRVGWNYAAGSAHIPILVTSDETANGQLEEIVLRTDRQDLPGLWRTNAQAQGLTVITGSRTSFYDGERVLPAGWCESPVFLSGTVSYGSGSVEGHAINTNVYTYRAVYAYRDAAGNTHYSEPSDPLTVEVSTDGVSTVATVGLEIRYTSLWHGPEYDVSRYQSRGYILLFRTLKNEAAPFYQMVTSVALPNDTHSYSTTHADTFSDAQLFDLGYGFIYTNGGILPAQPAPPSTGACVHGNRIWLIDAEDRRRVWCSRVLVPQEAPAFNEELTLRLDDSPDEITGIESLDSSLAIFTRTRVYLVDGDGPGDTGEGGAFSVRLLTTGSGCDDGRSLVRFDGGICYRDPSGLQLLARGGLPVPVGEAVRETVAAYPRCLGACHDATERRCLWLLDDGAGGDARAVVFDYRAGAWYTWSWVIDEVWSGLATYQGAPWLATSDGIWYPQASGYDSGSGWITMRVRTPWIRLGAVAGYQRARRLFVQGERLTDCSLTADVYLDHDGATAVDSFEWDLGPDTTATRLPRFALRGVLARQHGRSVAVELYDSAPEDQDTAERTGVRIFGLSLEIGAKPGPLWLSAGNKR